MRDTFLCYINLHLVVRHGQAGVIAGRAPVACHAGAGGVEHTGSRTQVGVAGAVLAAHATEALVGVHREEDWHGAGEAGLRAGGREAEVPGAGAGVLDQDLLVQGGGPPPGLTPLVQHSPVPTLGAGLTRQADWQRPVAPGQAARH